MIIKRAERKGTCVEKYMFIVVDAVVTHVRMLSCVCLS